MPLPAVAVPITGVLGGVAMSRVSSVNCSFSMLRRVSTPSVPTLSVTVTERSSLEVQV